MVVLSDLKMSKGKPHWIEVFTPVLLKPDLAQLLYKCQSGSLVIHLHGSMVQGVVGAPFWIYHG